MTPRTFLSCVVCFTLIIMLTEGFKIRLANRHGLTLQGKSTTDPTVREFAVHSLCNQLPGKITLYKAMKAKMCKMSDSFVANYVMEMCQEQSAALRFWVAELFDINGDGYITNWEKQFNE